MKIICLSILLLSYGSLNAQALIKVNSFHNDSLRKENKLDSYNSKLKFENSVFFVSEGFICSKNIDGSNFIESKLKIGQFYHFQVDSIYKRLIVNYSKNDKSQYAILDYKTLKVLDKGKGILEISHLNKYFNFKFEDTGDFIYELGNSNFKVIKIFKIERITYKSNLTT